MEARIKNPVLALPGMLEHLLALGKLAQHAGVPMTTLHLVYLRASQINGCSVCVDMHAKGALKDGETVERLIAVGAWREAPFFTAAERAALALTEATTRIADREDPVPDAVWAEAARHYGEQELTALVLNIGLINLFNRANVATRQPIGKLPAGAAH